MNNVVYVNFPNRHGKDERWNQVYKLDRLISESLTLKQLTELFRITPSRKYIDRAINVKKVSKSNLTYDRANKIIKLIEDIEKESNTLGKVYTLV